MVSTTNDNDSFQQIENDLRTLAIAHGMIDISTEDNQDTRSKRWKNILERRHANAEFNPDNESSKVTDSQGLSNRRTRSLFYRFARVVCQLGRIPRKELFETWAMALYVHQAFPNAQRIADLASGHGLLSWALLLLYNCDKTSGLEPVKNDGRLSVVCVDRQRLKAVDLIRTEMLQEWPHLEDSWDFVKGPVEAVVSDPSTLLVGIHACGTLSDLILSIAILGQSDLALVPCCHCKRSLTEARREQYVQETKKSKKEGPPADSASSPLLGMLQLADYIDYHRTKMLKDNGYYVEEVTIPRVFTPKNRILIARPPASPSSSSESAEEPVLEIPSHFQKRTGKRAPSSPIPVGNALHMRQEVRRMSSCKDGVVFKWTTQ